MWAQTAIVLAVWSAKGTEVPEMYWIMGPWLLLFAIYLIVRTHSAPTPHSIKQSCKGTIRIALHAAAVACMWKYGLRSQAWAAGLHAQLHVATRLSTDLPTTLAMLLFASQTLAVPHCNVGDETLVRAMLWPGGFDTVIDTVLVYLIH